MARLDLAIDRLFRDSGLELVFQSGAIPFVRTHRAKAEVLRQPLSTPQIVSAIAEILPPALRERFPKDGTTRFAYVSPAGPVQVRFDKWSDRVRAAVTPDPGAADEADGALAVFQGDPAPPIPPETLQGPSMPIPHRAVVERLAAGLTDPVVVSDVPVLRVLPAPAVAASAPVAPSADAGEAMAQLLAYMIEKKASDLHLCSDTVPMLRIDGDMVGHEAYRKVPPERLKELLWSIAPERNRDEWERRKDTDFAHETAAARFRVNVFADRKGIGAVLRVIPNTIRSAEELGLSKAILELCQLPKGLVLVTGPTGSGKSTTLAAMIDHINRTRTDHIITIEDPVEFVHANHRCLVNQREVGVHTGSFKDALRAALREDPDVLLVGELRDLETISIAIETAETGHLVFGTLHTNTAPSTVDRIIDQFPPDRQAQVRTMLSESLKGVVAQTLCKKIGGGRAAAQEILLSHSGVSNLIREGKTHQLASVLQTGRGLGMVTLNDALLDLVKRNVVAPEEALKKSAARAELKGLLERAGFKPDGEKAESRAA